MPYRRLSGLQLIRDLQGPQESLEQLSALGQRGSGAVAPIALIQLFKLSAVKPAGSVPAVGGQWPDPPHGPAEIARAGTSCTRRSASRRKLASSSRLRSSS